MRPPFSVILASAAIAAGFVQPLCAKAVSEGSAAVPPLSLEDREEAAVARIAIGDASLAEFRKIAQGPSAAAQAAASKADFRLIQFHVHTFPSGNDETTFAGVDCSVPWATGMTRAIWNVYVSGVISSEPPKPPEFDERVARAYNAALLAHPDFPYADLCASTDDANAKARKTKVRPPDDPTGQDRSIPTRWWWRWSERRLPNGLLGSRVSIAIRNGDTPARIENMDVDDVDELGMTALGWAAARAPRSVASRLLAEGADP